MIASIKRRTHLAPTEKPTLGLSPQCRKQQGTEGFAAGERRPGKSEVTQGADHVHGLLPAQVRQMAEDNLELQVFTHQIQLHLIFGPDLKELNQVTSAGGRGRGWGFVFTRCSF